jgi:hypothetical protein
MKEKFLAQRVRQPCAPAPRAIDIDDPSTCGHADKAVNDIASIAATVGNIISSNNNESEEEGGVVMA